MSVHLPVTPPAHSCRRQVGLVGPTGAINQSEQLSAVAETVGTFILIYGGTAVAVAALLARPVAGPGYDSLATPLAFGVALLIVDRVPAGLAPIAVGAAPAVAVFIAGPVTGGAVNPAGRCVRR